MITIKRINPYKHKISAKDMPSILVQLIISEMILIGFLYYQREIIKPVRKRTDLVSSLLKELSEWKGSHSNFIDYKKHQYAQELWFSAFVFTYELFLIGLIISFREFLISKLGIISFIVLLVIQLYAISRYCKKIVASAKDNSVKNIKILLENLKEKRIFLTRELTERD